MPGARQKGPRGWSAAQAYECADHVSVEVPCRTFGKGQSNMIHRLNRLLFGVVPRQVHLTPRNGIAYKTRGQTLLRLLVSDTELDRDASQIAKASRGIRTITFPNTVREFSEDAFLGASLRSVVLGEGIEKLEGHKDCRSRPEGIFAKTQVQQVTLPPMLRALGRCSFSNCKSLKQVKLANDCRLEEIGKDCFYHSGVEELTLQKTLKTVHFDAFYDCDKLKEIYVEDGCGVNPLGLEVSYSVIFGPPPKTMAGSARVWQLR